MGITGVVLAGGRSTRFGEDKRFFEIHGKPLLALAIEKIQSIFGEAYVVCDDQEFLRQKLKGMEHVRLVEDLEKFKGPLNGIFSFFKETSRRSGLFIPCDMPFLPTDFLRYLRDLALEFHLEKTILVSEKKPLPLFIPSSFLREMEEHLKKDNSIKGFIRTLKEHHGDAIYWIPEKELWRFGNPDHSLRNINTKQDLGDA